MRSDMRAGCAKIPRDCSHYIHVSRVRPSFHDSMITHDHARALIMSIHPNEHSKSFKKADKHQTSSPWDSIDSIALHRTPHNSIVLLLLHLGPDLTLLALPNPTPHWAPHCISVRSIKEHDTHRHSIGCTSHLHLVPIYRICWYTPIAKSTRWRGWQRSLFCLEDAWLSVLNK